MTKHARPKNLRQRTRIAWWWFNGMLCAALVVFAARALF